MSRTSETRFFAKVSSDGDCWAWGSAISTNGYGRFHFDRKQVAAHRWAFEFLRAEIPEGLQLDHLCKNKICVNPWHLEPVTASVNSARRSESDTCRNGHPREQSRRRPNGVYRCAPCDVQQVYRWRAANRDRWNAYQRAWYAGEGA